MILLLTLRAPVMTDMVLLGLAFLLRDYRPCLPARYLTAQP